MKRDLAGVGGEGRMRARDGGVETVGGDGREMLSVMKKKGNKNRRPVSVPASLRTTEVKRRATCTVVK